MLSRIFVWSVLFELMMIFTIPVFGQRPSVSRFIQVFVLISLVIKWFSSTRLYKLKVVNIFHSNYKYFTLYFLLAIFSGFIGVFLGAYSVDKNLSDINELASARTLMSPIENAILEYIITLYYFVYFTILSVFLLESEENINYFFSCFKFIFVVCLVIGFIDFGFSSSGYFILPSDIARGGNVGDRFHGLAGEPRDAFVFLFLGLATLYLQAIFRGVVLSKWWLLAVIAAAILTKSSSGLIGILIFLALYSGYIFSRFRVLQIFKVTALTFGIACFLYFSVISSDRTMLYVQNLSSVWNALEAGRELPFPISVQGYNIYPVYELTVKFRNLNFWPIFFGSGFGSASVVNNSYIAGYYWVSNPHSQFVRTIYETGIIGTLLFVFSFYYPVKYQTQNLAIKQKDLLILLIFLLIGLYFGHRHSAIYIFLGVFLAAFRILNRNKMKNSELKKY